MQHDQLLCNGHNPSHKVQPEAASEEQRVCKVAGDGLMPRKAEVVCLQSVLPETAGGTGMPAAQEQSVASRA